MLRAAEMRNLLLWRTGDRDLHELPQSYPDQGSA
jgi:hypothetical protein